ncbi:MAG: DUF1801 domain-containing protein [Phycisphaerales bacterium]|nr:DUF1801 domain-containing protein [Phycisphaerales bacterium]
MQSKAATVEQYIAELPEDRRGAIQAIRDVIRKNLDKGYEEGMSYGMIVYCIPHSIYPHGYHCTPKQALPFTGLASQKQYISMYLGSVDCWCDQEEPSEEGKWFKQAWLKTGRKLDMGKSCIRVKTLADVPLEVVGESIRRMPVKKFIEYYEASLRRIGKTPDGKRIPAVPSPKSRAIAEGRLKPGKKKAVKKQPVKKNAVKKPAKKK